MQNTRTLAMLLAFFALLVIGCGDEDEGPEDVGSGKPPAAMVGSWTYQSVTVNGAAASLATVLEWKPGAVAARLHIQSNSAYVYEEVDIRGGQLWFESGFVFIDGREMDINALQDGDGDVNETTRMGFALSDSTLTLTETDGGNTNVFALSK